AAARTACAHAARRSVYTAAVTWTRRSVLRALGTTAAAPVLAPLLGACPRASRPAATMAGVDDWSLADLRDELHTAVAELTRRFPRASALGVVRRAGHVSADATDQGGGTEREAVVVLRAGPIEHEHE